MRFRELISEAPTPVIPSEIDRVSAEVALTHAGDNQLGAGYFGSAFEKNADITTVNKVSRLNNNKWSDDGYYNYIEKIKNLSHFRYLPQIHSVQRIDPEHSPIYLVVNMEKLFSSHELSDEEVSFVLNNVVGKEPDHVWTQKNFNASGMRGPMTKATMLRVIGALLTSTAQNIPSERIDYDMARNLRIVDQDLLKAVRVISNLHKQGYSIDLHADNFMFRRTKYGPQLVLTDPLSFRSGPRIKVRMAKGTAHEFDDKAN